MEIKFFITEKCAAENGIQAGFFTVELNIRKLSTKQKEMLKDTGKIDENYEFYIHYFNRLGDCTGGIKNNTEQAIIDYLDKLISIDEQNKTSEKEALENFMSKSDIEKFRIIDSELPTWTEKFMNEKDKKHNIKIPIEEIGRLGDEFIKKCEMLERKGYIHNLELKIMYESLTE